MRPVKTGLMSEWKRYVCDDRERYHGDPYNADLEKWWNPVSDDRVFFALLS